MSARRSGRAKAPVKYTSASEGSDFEDKKPRKSGKPTPKKRTKTEQDPAETAATPKKRTKKDPETLAAEHREKAQAKEDKATKAQFKKSWEDWLEAHALPESEQSLDEEPGREESITQTDSLKKYGLKKEELGSLKHFEKRNPVYNNTIKLFLENDVKVLGYRKLGMLEGVEEKDVVETGQDIWKEEHKDDPKDDAEKKESPKKTSKSTKAKTPKQNWTAYIESHTVSSPDSLKEEPSEPINQSDCKAKYSLQPADLAVLPYFPKLNPKYGNTTKLFNENEVKSLVYRKAAVVAGVEENGEEALMKRGKELFEEGKEKEA